MKRSKHTLSHYRMVTTDMGRLTPIACIPVLPGDTIQHATSALVRLSPLNTPVMHPTQVRIHHFFVPNRITMPEWEDFITGGSDGADNTVIPRITTTADKRSILSYLGVPPIAGVDVSALPVRACNKIFNEFYRDQDLVSERDEDDITPMNIAWEKDYFTAARPWSQKGPDVTIPIGDRAPITGIGTNTLANYVPAGTNFRETGGGLKNYADAMTLLGNGNGSPNDNISFQEDPDNPGFLNIYADLSKATSASVNDWRAAFSIQRYQEARARYGSRFTEYLRYLGIRPSDARLQRPEYLGGGTTRVNFSEVLQTSPSADRSEPDDRDEIGVGDMYGHGVAGIRSNRYRKFFEEHGYVISMMSVRPKSIYMNGIPRDWLKRNKEDFFQKELANLGQQEVWQAELYAENTYDTFGFQDRYQEYRYLPSQVSQDFRDTLNAYHLARELQEDVTLNASFVECDPSKRIFQITDPNVDSLWVMCNHHVVARRMVPKRANPRIL